MQASQSREGLATGVTTPFPSLPLAPETPVLSQDDRSLVSVQAAPPRVQDAKERSRIDVRIPRRPPGTCNSEPFHLEAVRGRVDRSSDQHPQNRLRTRSKNLAGKSASRRCLCAREECGRSVLPFLARCLLVTLAKRHFLRCRDFA